MGVTLCPQPWPFQSSNMEWKAEQSAVLEVHLGQEGLDGDQEVLIKWADSPEFEATWELTSVIAHQFPNFHLVSLQEVLINLPFVTHIREGAQGRAKESFTKASGWPRKLVRI